MSRVNGTAIILRENVRPSTLRLKHRPIIDCHCCLSIFLCMTTSLFPCRRGSYTSLSTTDRCRHRMAFWCARDPATATLTLPRRSALRTPRFSRLQRRQPLVAVCGNLSRPGQSNLSFTTRDTECNTIFIVDAVNTYIS